MKVIADAFKILNYRDRIKTIVKILNDPVKNKPNITLPEPKTEDAQLNPAKKTTQKDTKAKRGTDQNQQLKTTQSKPKLR